MIISCIPYLSTVTPITAVIPICFVLFVSAIRELAEDLKRHASDSQFNKTKYSIFNNAEEVVTTSKQLTSGTLLKLTKNDMVPADVIPVFSSNMDGVIFLETAALDGETSLKQVFVSTSFVDKSLEEIKLLKGELLAEAPNTNFHQFKASVRLSDSTISLNGKNFMPQGTILRNTDVVYAIVCYCGKHTKLSMNSTKPPDKTSKLDVMLNQFVLSTVLCQLFICVVLSTLSAWRYSFVNPDNGYWYLKGSHDEELSVIGFGVKQLFGYFNLTSYTIPISVGVSLEVAQFIQGLVMESDNYFKVTDTNTVGEKKTVGMKTNSCSMNAELGSVEYILSDKTGTLTENHMQFDKCSVNGKVFKNVCDGSIKTYIESEEMDKENSEEIANENFDRASTIELSKEFLLCLSLCNTCVTSNEDDITYQSSSPDEIALCEAASKNGYKLIEKTQRQSIIEVNNQNEAYTTMHILEFSSLRKRMSILVEKNGVYTLYCKGADNIIANLLSEESLELSRKIQNQINEFSSEGLRTLFVAKRQFDNNFIDNWLQQYDEASQLINEREQQIEKLYKELEVDLKLLGATAIEDQLQEGVPETVQALREAGMKVWVITGDKMETAISVGFSCKLFTTDHELIKFNCQTETEFDEKLKTAIEYCKTVKQPLGIIINANNVDMCIKNSKLFAPLAEQAESMICCRVTPIQKANITTWVKKMTNKKCLTIGDGANDVPMINRGDVGVGIYGKEGNQAAITSDYAIRRFKHLKKLVLYYGRNSLYRNSTLIKMCFYKNSAFFLMDVWYAFISNFSCQILYDDWIMTCFNIIFTSFPPLAIALFDFDLSWETITKNPSCHRESLKSRDYNILSYVSWYFYGVLQSLLFFLVFYYLIIPSDVTTYDGKVNGFTYSFVTVTTYSILSILITMVIHTRRYCLFLILSYAFSFIAYFFTYAVIMFVPGLSVYNLSHWGWLMVLQQPSFYLLCVIAVVVSSLPQIVTIFYRRLINPYNYHILQEVSSLRKHHHNLNISLEETSSSVVL
ncbi:Phospholipid-transporting ATPase [Entamoeba marina]